MKIAGQQQSIGMFLHFKAIKWFMVLILGYVQQKLVLSFLLKILKVAAKMAKLLLHPV
jgi:hypothetical protein